MRLVSFRSKRIVEGLDRPMFPSVYKLQDLLGNAEEQTGDRFTLEVLTARMVQRGPSDS